MNKSQDRNTHSRRCSEPGPWYRYLSACGKERQNCFPNQSNCPVKLFSSTLYFLFVQLWSMTQAMRVWSSCLEAGAAWLSWLIMSTYLLRGWPAFRRVRFRVSVVLMPVGVPKNYRSERHHLIKENKALLSSLYRVNMSGVWSEITCIIRCLNCI